MNLNKLKKLSGDASFRNFYRKKINNKTSIIVYAKKDKKSNLLNYDAVNKILNKYKIKAPKLISQNYKKNYIEIEDFGDQTIVKNLKKNNAKKLYYFKRIIFLLKNLQKIKKITTKTFLDSKYRIPLYSKNKLINETKLFIDWYLPKHIKGKNKNLIKMKLIKIFKSLLNQLNYKKKVFVHRDFHVSNMMFTQEKKIGLIDNQDAVVGSIAYDLASLIDDVRFKTNNNIKKYILKEFLKENNALNKYKFKSDFEILSVLRNLKIIGIFTRLSVRDKKNKYLKLIPYAWRLIELRISNNSKFSSLKKILDENFDSKVRNIYEN